MGLSAGAFDTNGFCGFVFFGLQGLWQESMQTLALTLVSVIICVIIGLPLGVWAGIMLVRLRSLSLLRTWWAGFVEGWRTDPGVRRPMRWSTVWRMTRLGRPPII